MRRLRPFRVVAAILVLLFAFGGLAQAISTFEPKDYPERVVGEHFTVYYSKTGPDATTAEYAQNVLNTGEDLYQQMVVQAGFRPPRAPKVPIVLASTEGQAGSVHSTYLGFDTWMQIDPSAEDPGSTIAHEFFHLLQLSYDKGGARPDWAIEGTATAATPYLFPKGSTPWKHAMHGHLSLYWSRGDTSLKATDYMPNLFFYWVADQYGKLAFLDRLLTWAETLDWERAIQLAAIQGGAPPDTTFDKLWRAFVLALVDGRLPAGYETANWFSPTTVVWNGTNQEVAYGKEFSGHNQMSHTFTYSHPLMLGAYSFRLVDIQHVTGAPLELTVTGDPNAVEAYVIRSGPNLRAALVNGQMRPDRTRPAAPPTDPATVGARVPLRTPVRIDGQSYDRTLVLLMRLGNWGHGEYSLQLKAGAGAEPPLYLPLTKILHGPDSAGSPPPLTDREQQALVQGTLLKGTTPLKAEIKEVKAHQFSFAVGGKTMDVNGTVIELPLAVTKDPQGRVWVPLRPLARALGATIDGNRYTIGKFWIDISPYQPVWTSSKGRFGPAAPAKLVDGELVVTTDLFFFMGCSGRGTDPAHPNQTFDFFLPLPGQ